MKRQKLFGYKVNVKPIKNPFWKLPKITKKENYLINKKPFGDYDKDKVLNIFDCKPTNKRKQGFQHEYSFSSVASKNIRTVKMPPELFLKTTYGEAVRRGAEKGYNNYKYNLTYGASGIAHKENHYKNVNGNPVKLPKMTKETGIKKRILSRSYHLPIPFLTYNEKGKAIGHEGRHTALAAQRMGLKYIPVTIEKPKETKLTTKYKTLETIYGKQYQDWKYDERKRQMKPSPMISSSELEEPQQRIHVTRIVDENGVHEITSGVPLNRLRGKEFRELKQFTKEIEKKNNEGKVIKNKPIMKYSAQDYIEEVPIEKFAHQVQRERIEREYTPPEYEKHEYKPSAEELISEEKVHDNKSAQELIDEA